MSIGGSSGKQTTTSEPWRGAVPYLTGGKTPGGEAVPGIFQEAANLYQSGGWNPSMEATNELYKSLFPGRLEGTDRMVGIASGIADGQFDSVINPAQRVTTQGVDPVAARAAQGALDPSNALAQLLTGQVNNQYLDPLMQTMMTNITRNTTENVLPGLRSSATGAGQYGSSRQGVAEGLAVSRLNQDLSTGIAPVYAQAFENAQNRMGSTASELNQQAVAVANANADRDLNAGQFNANLTLQENQQNMAANQANLANRLRASDLYGQALNFQDLGFDQYQQLLGLPTAYDRANLGAYAGIITPGAGLGGSSTQTANQGRSPIASAAGGAALGFGIGGGPVGAGIGGLLGLLTGLV